MFLFIGPIFDVVLDGGMLHVPARRRTTAQRCRRPRRRRRRVARRALSFRTGRGPVLNGALLHEDAHSGDGELMKLNVVDSTRSKGLVVEPQYSKM